MSQAEALILSIAVEAVVAFVLVRALGWGGGVRAALSATVGTLASHPVAWPAMLALMAPFGYWTALAAVEGGVVLAESLAYRLIVPLSWRRALAASLVANAASTGAALAYYALQGGLR